MKRAPFRLAATISFSAESAKLDAWGWLSELSTAGARLCTLAELKRDEAFQLEFELAGEKLSALSCRARWVERDSEGYWDCELAFTDLRQRNALSRALLDLLSRVP